MINNNSDKQFPEYILPKVFTSVYVFTSDILMCQDTVLFFEALQKFAQTIGETQFIVEHIGELSIALSYQDGTPPQTVSYFNFKEVIPIEVVPDVLRNGLLQPNVDVYYFTVAMEGIIYGTLPSWFIYHTLHFEVLIVGVDESVEKAFKQCVLNVKDLYSLLYQDKVELEQNYVFRHEKYLRKFMHAYPMWSGLKG